MARTLTVGSTNFFKAVEGVKGRWTQRSSSSGASSVTSSGASSVNSDRVSGYSTPVEVSKSDLVDDGGGGKTATQASFMRPFSFAGLNLGGTGAGEGQGQGTAETRTAPPTPSTATPLKTNVAAWSAGIGSFLSTRAPRFSISSAVATSSRGESSSAPPLSASSHQPQQEGVGVGLGGALSREQSRTVRSVTPPVAGRMVPPLGSVNGVGVEVAEVGRRKSAASDDGHRVHLDGEEEVVSGYAL